MAIFFAHHGQVHDTVFQAVMRVVFENWYIALPLLAMVVGITAYHFLPRSYTQGTIQVAE